MSKTKQVSFEVGEATYDTVRYTVLDAHEDYDSFTEFVQKAVRRQASSISSLADGGQPARQLIRLFSQIRGIDEDVPEDNTEATIKGENVSDIPFSVELAGNPRGDLNDICDNTGRKRPAAVRRCIYWELKSLAQHTSIFQQWQEKCIVRTWTELQKGLILPQHRCYEMLTRRFVNQIDTMEWLISLDPEPFNDFAEVYTSNFIESRSYELLKEKYGGSTFTDVENAIEEQTDFSIERGTDDTDFLAGVEEVKFP